MGGHEITGGIPINVVQGLVPVLIQLPEASHDGPHLRQIGVDVGHVMAKLAKIPVILRTNSSKSSFIP